VRTISTFDELVELVRRHPRLCVRHSAGPAADAGSRSVDYEAEVDLPGWSVTPLGPEPWWSRPVEDWVARRVCKYLELTDHQDDRRPWVLTGRVVGHGPDHEPLVVDIEPVGWIGPDVVAEARHLYHSRFAVGRATSTT
jgi:hypothetical protein